MLDEGSWHFAIDDARRRHEAVVGLIYHLDQQAIALVSLYVSLALAAISGAVASIGIDASAARAIAPPLAAASASLVLGCFECFKVLDTRKVNLPGRPPEFWIWAARGDIALERAYGDYLQNLETKLKQNDEFNVISSAHIRRARQYGIAAPIVALIGAALITATSFLL